MNPQPSDLRAIRAAIGRVRRRIRAQRAIDASVLFTLVGLGLGGLVLGLSKTGLLEPAQATIWLIAAGALPLVGAALGAMLPLRALVAEKLLDRSHGLRSRIASAIEFAGLAERTPFQDAAIADAAQSAGDLSAKKAFPFRRPQHLYATAMLALLVTGIAFLEVRDQVPVAAARTLTPMLLHTDDLGAFGDDLDALLQDPETSDEVRDAARRFNQLVEDLADRRLDRTEALRRIRELEDRMSEGRRADAQALEDALRQLGEEMRRSELTRAASDALRDADPGAAEEAVRELAAQLRENPPDRAELERLRDALRRASEARREDLEREIEEQRERMNRLLERQREKQGLNEREQRLLNRQRRELERLQRQQQEYEQARRELERLQRELGQAAEDLNRDGGEQDASESLDRAAEDLHRQAQQQMSEEQLRQMTEQLRQLREMLRRQRQQQQNGQGQQGQGQGQGRMDRFVMRAQGQGQQGQGTPIVGPGQQGQGQGQGQGQQGQGQGQGQQGQQGQGQGQGQGEGQGEGEQQRVLQLGGQGGGQQAMLELPGMGQQQGQGGVGQGQGQQGPGAGQGHDPTMLDDPTRLNGDNRNVRVEGEQTQGATRSEVILSAADRGFASRGYRDVYTDYESHAEEVLERDEVPQGYRFYVRRYFQLIRPRDGAPAAPDGDSSP